MIARRCAIKRTLRAALALLAAGCAQPAFDPTPIVDGAIVDDTSFVHACGTRICGGDGAPILLEGVNLGAWLHWEGWIWGAGWKSEKEVAGRLRELVGDAELRRFVARVHDTAVTDEDIAAIKALGFNSVRVPFNHTLLQDDDVGGIKERGFLVLDRLLDACERHGVLAVLDLHAAPGGQAWPYMADPDDVKLWDDPRLQERTVALWRAIARRYRERTIVAGYDLLNEPAAPSNDALFSLYVRIAQAVVDEDPHHMIIVEGSSFASDISWFPRRITANQAYSFHMYTFVGDPRVDELGRFHDTSVAHEMPLWAGEFGQNSIEMMASTTALFRDERFDVSGHAFWTWKKVENGSAAIVRMPTSPRWQLVADWVDRPWSPRPTNDEARAGLSELVHALRFRDGEVDDDTVKALLGR